MSDTEPYEERDTDARHETNTDGIGNIVLETEQKRPKPSAKKNPTVLREEGRSLLPHTRVQKIIKADKDLPIVAREAVFAISIATEEFVKKLANSSFREAERNNRTTVQPKDIITIVNRSDEFFFLEDIVADPPAVGIEAKDATAGLAVIAS